MTHELTRKIYKRNYMKKIAIQENNTTAWERSQTKSLYAGYVYIGHIILASNFELICWLWVTVALLATFFSLLNHHFVYR